MQHKTCTINISRNTHSHWQSLYYKRTRQRWWHA